MTCQKCNSTRILDCSAKTSDRFSWSMMINYDVKDDYGEVPSDFGLGGGDYLQFRCCLDCGQIQGDWPLPETEFEEKHRTNEEQ